MPDLVISKDATGKLSGLSEKGRRAYDKFRKVVSELPVGHTLKFSYKLPRSARHHAYFFAKLQGLYERQERFEDVERLLQWIKVGAGYADFMPTSEGVVAVAQSIAWESLEEQDFIEFHRAATDFLYTERALGYLWPHMTYEQAYKAIDRWHRDYTT